MAGERHDGQTVPLGRGEPEGISQRLTIMAMNRRAVVISVLAVSALAGCGDPSGGPPLAAPPTIAPPTIAPSTTGAPSTSPPPSSVAPPATRLIERPPEPGDADFETITALDPAAVDEPCPADVPVDMNTTSSSPFAEQSRLEPMLGVVLHYGSERPDVFGGYGLHWYTSEDAAVFVSFTGDLAEHRAALAELVEYPDDLIVCQAPASEADRNAIQATLLAELDGRFTSLGSGGKAGAVTVGLVPTDEALAAELVERYGAAVDITVGALAYPLDDAVDVCGPALEPTLRDGLEVTLVEADEPLVVTDLGTVALSIRLTNTGDQPILFDSGQPTATLTDAAGAVRSVDMRGVADVGIEIALEPGVSEEFDLDVALASCDPTDGYLLPAGDHFVVVSVYDGEAQAMTNSHPLPVTIPRQT